VRIHWPPPTHPPSRPPTHPVSPDVLYIISTYSFATSLYGGAYLTVQGVMSVTESTCDKPSADWRGRAKCLVQEEGKGTRTRRKARCTMTDAGGYSSLKRIWSVWNQRGLFANYEFFFSWLRGELTRRTQDAQCPMLWRRDQTPSTQRTRQRPLKRRWDGCCCCSVSCRIL
jgi:hypothetical protein